MHGTFLPTKAMQFKQTEMPSESADLYILIDVCRRNTICYNYDTHLRTQRRVSISLHSGKKKNNVLTFGRICLHSQNGC
jgi:hypothetical protein